MIRLQIVEREGADLKGTLTRDMRKGALRTFSVAQRGRRVTHISPNYPGWMNWQSRGGVLDCEILSPRRPGEEWKFLRAFIGRLAHRYADRIRTITIQFSK